MKKYNTQEITSVHELLMCEEYGPVNFLKNFPIHTSPFWNMKMNGDLALKTDVIL